MRPVVPIKISTPFFEALSGDAEVKAVISFESDRSAQVRLKLSEIKLVKL